MTDRWPWYLAAAIAVLLLCACAPALGLRFRAEHRQRQYERLQHWLLGVVTKKKAVQPVRRKPAKRQPPLLPLPDPDWHDTPANDARHMATETAKRMAMREEERSKESVEKRKSGRVSFTPHADRYGWQANDWLRVDVDTGPYRRADTPPPSRPRTPELEGAKALSSGETAVEPPLQSETGSECSGF